MRVLPLAAALLTFTALLAGCASSDPDEASDDGASTEPWSVSFGEPVMVDAERIASEPTVKAAADGSYLVCAPTGNIKYATRPQDLPVMADKGAFQSAIWRSTDNGTTWARVGTMGLPYHSPMPGGGDCDMATDAGGAVYMTDQVGLATEVVSVSHDNGASWAAGSPLASGDVGVDRQWLRADPTEPGVVYLVYNLQARGITVSKTTDGGATWTAVTATSYSAPPGTMVAVNGTVAFAHDNGGGQGFGFVHSEDGGATWTEATAGTDRTQFLDFFPQLFSDRAGTLYLAWTETGEPDAAGNATTSVAYVYSHDLGATWSEKTVAFARSGRVLFLWGAAGSAGRVGFSWYEAPDPQGDYFVHGALVDAADTPAPRFAQARVDPVPARSGPPCESGSTCLEGRELGDYQSVAVDPEGHLLVSYVRVLSAQDGGRVMFARSNETALFLPGETYAPWVV